MTIRNWLEEATYRLTRAEVPSARLDARLLLEDELQKDALWIAAHDDAKLAPTRLEGLDAKLERRIAREPLAYIRGFVEFYGRKFTVTPDVLIPRPETEALIEKALALPLKSGSRVLDVGTGSGCIGISLKLEKPGLMMLQSDISPAALQIAEANASRLGAHSTFIVSDLLDNYFGNKLDLIIANLPYVDNSWETSPEVAAEPDVALYTGDGGLELIKRLIRQAPSHLMAGGYLLLEADPRQFDAIRDFSEQAGLRVLGADGFTISLQLR